MEEINVVDATESELVTGQEEQEETTESEQSEVASTPAETKPIQTPEENAKFAELRRKYETEKQSEKDALIAEIYGDSGIYTEADLRRAQKEQEAENLGLEPEDYEALELGKSIKQKESQKQSDIDAILALAAKEGFNPSELPEEVLNAWNGGEGGRLVEIYKNHTNTKKETEVQERITEMEKKLVQYEKALGIQKANEENSNASTGGVGGNGQNETVGYISQELFDKNKSDPNWVMKYLTKITESRKKW